MNEIHIPISDFCTHEKIEFTFVSELIDEGLIRVITVNETRCVTDAEIPQIKRYARMYRELGVNVAGLDVIRHLHEQMAAMRGEMERLEEKVRRLER